MLYNKDWEKPEVKADPYSFDNLIEWLEMQPAEEQYNYNDPMDCLLALWLKSKGKVRTDLVNSSFCYFLNSQSVNLSHLAWLADGNLTFHSQTFGMALSRAKVMRDA